MCVSMMRVRADELMKSYVVFETKYICIYVRIVLCVCGVFC